MDDLRKSVDKLAEHVEKLSVLEYRINRAEGDIKEVATSQVKSDERRSTDRRLVFTALIAPILMFVVQLYAKAKGVA